MSTDTIKPTDGTDRSCPYCAGLGYIMAFIGPEEDCEECGGTGIANPPTEVEHPAPAQK